MAKTRRNTPTEPPEQPVEKPKARKALKPLTVTVDDLKAAQAVTTAAEIAPPVREVIETPPEPRPRPAKNSREYPTFEQKLEANRREAMASRRLDGTERPFVDRVGAPTRPRTPEERGDMLPDSFTSKTLDIVKDGQTWQVRARRELTGDEKDLIAKQGFLAVDDAEMVSNAEQREIARVGGDVNLIGYVVGKGQGKGR